MIVYVSAVDDASDWPGGDFATVTYEVVAAAGYERGRGAVGVVVVAGEIDMMTEPMLTERLDEALSSEPTGAVVIDLSGVTFFGSSGIAALAVARERGQTMGVEVAMVLAPGSATDRTLRVMGMTQLLPTYPDRAAALAVYSSGAATHPGSRPTAGGDEVDPPRPHPAV